MNSLMNLFFMEVGFRFLHQFLYFRVCSEEAIQGHKTNDPTGQSPGECEEGPKNIPRVGTWGGWQWQAVKTGPCLFHLILMSLSHSCSCKNRPTLNPCLPMFPPIWEQPSDLQAPPPGVISAPSVDSLPIIHAWGVGHASVHQSARTYTTIPVASNLLPDPLPNLISS